MATLDLSGVTRSLVTLVDEAIKASPARPAAHAVTSLPPDMLADDNSVGIYLYHLGEEPALRNQPWRGRPETPIRYSPLALNLHYVVTAHSTAVDEHGPYREQLLMGLAVKALHDHAVIDDHSEVRGVPLLHLSLRAGENPLRLSLRQVPASEAVSYWTAGSKPLRLAAYYEVSVVLLEPEEPSSAGGRVLSWGVEAFIGALPRLNASRSTVRFTIPGEAAARAIEVQPAQGAIGDEVTLIGTDLGGGTLDVLVRRAGWPAARSVAATWGASSAGDRVFVTVQELIDTEPALPGAYTAAVEITRTTRLADGTSHPTTVRSNETPFQIAPTITAVSAPTSDGVLTVSGGPFTAAPALVTRASIASRELAPGTAGALQPGQFAVSAAAIEMRLPPGLPSGSPVPVRVIVDGSESAPRWVVTP
jgi:hypothetical protein